MDLHQINPVASGNKTLSGLSATGGAGIMGLAIILLPMFGIDDKTTTIILGIAPNVLLLIGGVLHKIAKGGGILKIIKDMKKRYIG